MLVVDGYGIFFRAVIIGVGFLSTLASLSYLEREDSRAGGEFYSLILFSMVGQCIMVTADDLIMVFIGLEISSIATYVMAGFLRDDRRNNESALKYFLLGSFATAFLLYGTAWIFGLVGSTNLEDIRKWMPENQNGHYFGGGGVRVCRIGFQGFGGSVSDVGPRCVSGCAGSRQRLYVRRPQSGGFRGFFPPLYDVVFAHS